MNIILQRQGISDTLRTTHDHLLTPGVGNDAPPFYAEIQRVVPISKDTREIPQFIANVSHNNKSYRLPTVMLTTYMSFNHCRTALAALLTKLAGETVTIDDRIEAYSSMAKPGDVFFPRARYEEGSDTIRSVPENYCLIRWLDGDIKQPVFSTDASTDDEARNERNQPHIHPNCYWRKICEKAHDSFLGMKQWEKPYSSIVQEKHWLAWLISEYRKYGVQS